MRHRHHYKGWRVIILAASIYKGVPLTLAIG
jgi:hypothetical protein